MLALVGAALVVATQAFSPEVTGWLTFGVALGVLTLVGIAQLDARRGPVQRSLDAGAAAIALWAAVASVVFTGTTLVWLLFGEALGIVGLALIGLVAHELWHEHAVRDAQAIPSDARASARKEELSAAARALMASALVRDYLRPGYIFPVCGARNKDRHTAECPWQR